MTKQTPNRLSAEKSPYLLQHANNPVDWYPWGDEAFEHARAQQKPIFLSIGYSTCHWCHVMERESFEDEQVAGLLNKHFVAIKVDREERPDIDQQYMEVCQALTASGGWPLTAVLTPAGEAFFAGTYFPKTSRFGRTGMMDLLPQIAELWRERRAEAVRAAAEITRAVHQPRRGPTAAATAATATTASGASPIAGPTEAWLRGGFEQLYSTYDHQHGGFGGRPKFPQPLSLLFLLRYWRRTGEARALGAVEETLRHMRLGGVYDQLGGGFHRYATDRRWFLPHFEKMLYDQALLTLAYTEAHQATGKDQYRAVAEGILAYVLRDLTAPDGGFYSAEDADSEGVEGKFYVWTAAELYEALGPILADDFLRAYGARADGNYSDEATGEPTRTNILYLADENLWAALGQPPPDRFAEARRTLLDRRAGRVRPLRDDKILTDWNGLMIAAMARAGGAFDERGYTEAAARAAAFILAARESHDGRLLHRYRDGEWRIPAFLDDYANLAWGLIELYNATWQAAYLRSALELSELSWEALGDPAADGLYFAPEDASGTLIRQKTAYDGATPSGNAVTANNLLRLGRLLARPDLEDRAASVMRYLAAESAGQAWGHALFFCALDYAIGPTQEVVIAGDLAQPATQALRDEVNRGFSPRRTVLHLPAAPAHRAAVTGLAPFTADLPDPAGAAAAYLCESGACQTPISDPGGLRAALSSRPRP